MDKQDYYSRAWPVYVFVVFLITRFLIVMVGYVSYLIIIPGGAHPPPSSFIDLFAKWDAGWYLSIARDGYQYIPGKTGTVAFFPLYPLLVKAASALISDLKISGYFISNLSLLAAAYYFYLLTYLDTGSHETSRYSVLYLLIAPVGFFFSSIFTESTFLLFTIASFYYARREKWFVAALIGSLASATRALGVLIIIPLLLEYWQRHLSVDPAQRRGIRWDILYLLLVPVGLLAYMTFLYFRFGDPWALVAAQVAYGRKFSGITFALDALFLESPFYILLFFSSFVIALLSILGMLMCRMRISHIAYCFFYILITISTGTFKSMPRIVSVLFPIYLFMAVTSTKVPFAREGFTVLSIGFLSVFTILFVNGYWFA
jgi:hypothetical protein